jgi:hypothetical protein
MLVGYNTNISYKGTVYHVQTEDSGIKNPHIITLLYYKGAILASKKIGYANIAADPDYKEKVRELMKEQHKAMIRELIAGKHTQEQAAPQAVQEFLAVTEVASDDAATVRAIPADSTPSAAEKPVEPEQGPKKLIAKSLDDILLDYILEAEK